MDKKAEEVMIRITIMDTFAVLSYGRIKYGKKEIWVRQTFTNMSRRLAFCGQATERKL
jgi:hypothetical protein